MKNFTKIFMAVVAGMFAFSCVTDTTEDLGVKLEGQGGVYEVAISLEASRTQLGEKADGNYPLYWSEGDAISVNGVVSNPLEDVSATATAATFKLNEAVARPLCIVYPANAAVAAEDEVVEEPAAPTTVYPVNFLAEQPYTVGTFAPQAAPMYGYGAELGEGEAESAVQLQHLTGVLRLAIAGNGEKVTSIVVKAQKGKIAGPFTVDCTNGTLTAQDGATNNVTVTCGEGLVLGTEATPVYLTVPAGQYGTFVITVNTEAHGKMTVKFDSDLKPITAGNVREFSKFTFAANANDSEEVFLIDSEEALIEFARIAGAFYPRTKAVVTEDIDMTDYDWKTIEKFDAVEFDGGDCTIKGLNAPLFGTTTATIKNLILTDVNYTVTDLAHSGAIVCNLYGDMDNCSASGEVTINNTTFAPEKITNQYEEIVHGGMVGIAHGSTITNCTSDVDVNVVSLCDPSKSIKAAAGAMIGGAAGGCTFSDLTNNGNVVYSGTTQKGNLYMSGVIGKGNTTEGDFAFVAVDRLTNNGTVSSTKESVIGGSLILAGITGDLLPGREVACSYLKNTGAITHCGESGNVSMGGVIGYQVKASLSQCSNSGNITIEEGATVKDAKLAGLIVDTFTTNNTEHLSNSGNITVKKATATIVRLAGVLTGSSYSLSLKNLSNTGKIEVVTDATATAIYMSGVSAGAVKTQHLESATNTGTLTIGDNITCSDYIQVAGLVNSTSGEGDVTPLIKKCSNSGAISVGKVTTTNTGNNGRIYLVGLIGTCNAGNLNECYNEVTGTITATDCTLSKEFMVGGLIGYIGYQNAIKDQVISITDCENKAAISLSPVKSVNAYVGGAVGQAWAEKTDQTIKLTRVKNSGHLSMTGAAWGTPYIAGIWAQPNNYSVVELDGCENSGNITFSASTTTKNKPFLGGIMGHETNKKSVSIKNCTNKGNVNLASLASSCRIAGILASKDNANSIMTLDGCTNLGTIQCSYTQSANSNAWAVGGVVGYNASGKVTIKNCTNGSKTDSSKGTVTIGEAVGGVGVGGMQGLGNAPIEVINCKNYGNVSQTGIGGYYLANPKTNRYIGIGGMVGYNLVAGTSITNCENHGLVEYGTAAANNRTNIGGIFGLSTTGTEAAPNVITNCKNYGTVKHAAASCGQETTVAGIIGFPQGKTIITNCENTSTGIVWAAGKCSSNYDIGGVVGGPNNSLVNITYCTNNGTVMQTKTNNGQNYIGGVVGYAYTWGVISHCTNNGAIETVGSAKDKRDYVGGIVGYARHMSGNSELSNCVNTYPLVFTGVAGTVYHGGICGAMTHEDADNKYTFVTENLYNLADLTFEGKSIGVAKDKETGQEVPAPVIKCGGISGYIQSPISNSYCYANIKAFGLEGKVGLISGSARMSNKNEKVLNCGVGGNLIFSEKEETDAGGEAVKVEELTPITNDNFHTYLYSVAIDAALAIEEGNSVLLEKPATPNYTYNPAQ